MTVDPAGDGGGAVAAVVVNYEAGAVLVECVATLRSQGVAELVVVDNGSRDGSVDDLRRRFPDVDVLTAGANLGYGAGANRGLAATRAPYVLVCNPDLSLPPGAVAALVEGLEADPGAAVAGPLIRTPTGERYPSARQFPSLVDAAGHAMLGLFVPSNPFTRAYQRTDLPPAGGGATPVDWVSGACMLVRRTAAEQVGGFDEAYFMYAEDVDLCWRIGNAGWTVLYVPAAEVTHLQGVSTAGHPYRMILEHHRSLLRFAGRSTRGWRRLLLPLVAVGIGARAVLACGRALAGA
jgi:N-acetylglucosaminyl-diphospho-decaprenol L-rhamnosyltransferase